MLDKYVNIKKVQTGSQVKPLNQDFYCQMRGVDQPEIFEFYEAYHGHVQRQPGTLAPEGSDIYLKIKENDGFVTLRKKKTAKQMIKRFRTYATMIGKLKASMN